MDRDEAGPKQTVDCVQRARRIVRLRTNHFQQSMQTRRVPAPKVELHLRDNGRFLRSPPRSSFVPLTGSRTTYFALTIAYARKEGNFADRADPRARPDTN